MIQFYEFGDFRIDVASQKLLKDGEPIPLTHKTFEILLFLIKNQGRVLRKQEFLNSVWSSSFVDETNLTQHIYRIRKMLGDSNNEDVVIETIPKLGYKFTANIKEISVELPDESLIKDSYPSSQNSVIEEAPVHSGNYEVAAVSKVPIDRSSSVQETQINASDTTNNKPKYSLLRKLVLIKVGLVLIGLLGYSTYLFLQPLSAEPAKNTVAVLPFRQIGNFRNDELQIGIAETVTSNLGKIDDVTVVPTDSVLLYSGSENSDKTRDIFEIGKKLKADIVLAATIQRENNSIRVNVQFYHVENRKQVCTAKFDEEFSDVFTLQDDISTKVTTKLIKEFSKHPELKK